MIPQFKVSRDVGYFIGIEIYCRLTIKHMFIRTECAGVEVIAS